MYNFTFHPQNPVQNDYEQVFVTLEVVGQVQGIKLDDFRIITNKEQSKPFEITFDSLGAGTCVVIDYKDGLKAAYGDPEFCKAWPRSSELPYIEGFEVILDPFIFQHVF